MFHRPKVNSETPCPRVQGPTNLQFNRVKTSWCFALFWPFGVLWVWQIACPFGAYWTPLRHNPQDLWCETTRSGEVVSRKKGTLWWRACVYLLDGSCKLVLNIYELAFDMSATCNEYQDVEVGSWLQTGFDLKWFDRAMKVHQDHWISRSLILLQSFGLSVPWQGSQGNLHNIL